MALGQTLSQPTRFPGGLTNVPRISPLAMLEDLSPIHEVFLGWQYQFPPGQPTGNTPATNADWTVTSTTTTGTASYNPANTFPPTHLLTTGTTASDQVVMQDKRTLFTNFLLRRKVIIAGSFQITSTVANAAIAFGLFTGTSLASLGTDQFLFNKPSGGSTLNFLNRNNSGTLLTTAVSTAILINTTYGAVAMLDPSKGTVSIWFGVINGLDLTNTTLTPNEMPATNTIPVVTANIPDGTNALTFGFGAQTSAGAAATVQFGPSFAFVV